MRPFTKGQADEHKSGYRHSAMKLSDIAHLLPAGAMATMQLLEAVGMALESDGANVTDLGWDFPHAQAEMCFTAPDGRRLEMVLRELPTE